MAMEKKITWGYRDLPENPPVALVRIADQIDFFDKRSKQNQTRYKRMKFVTLLFSALVTVSGVLPLPVWVVPMLGASIVVVEGVVQMNSMVQNWLSYRNTCEALKHEKYLALNRAGPYKDEDNPNRLLAERTEEILGKDRASWIAAQHDNHRKLAVKSETSCA
jgi:hypothetical protein